MFSNAADDTAVPNNHEMVGCRCRTGLSDCWRSQPAEINLR
jgi:hypothetical protein